MSGVHKTALATTFLVVVLAGWYAAPEAQGPPQPPPGQERRRYVVEFDQVGPGAAAAVRTAGGDVVHEFPQFGMAAAWLPEAALAVLRNNPNVRSIEEDPLRFPFADTVPYGITMVQADLVDEPAPGEPHRKVCIIDSGYSLGHPDLPTTATGVDDPNAGPWSQDGCGHGTHVAGTIAAIGNGQGVVGVLPDNRIGLHIVRVFANDCGWAYASDLAAAVNQCRAAGAHVVNMSLGGPLPSTAERNAFDAAYAASVLSVAAAGNDGNTAISYPAGYSSVVSVAAVDQNMAVATFSQKNADVELAAPGVNVLSTVPWLEQNSVTAAGVTYNGLWIEFSGRTVAGGITGQLVSGGLCNSAGSWPGQIVLCERGILTYSEKVDNVRAGGGKAVVVYNNVPGELLGTLLSDDPTPAIGITQADGQLLLKTGIGQTVTFVSYRHETAGSYEAWSGTSMATPHVAGVAALVWSRYPTKTAAEIRNALNASAEDLGPAGKDTSFGYGLVQARAALELLEAGGPPQQPPPSTITMSAVRRGKKVDLSWSGTLSSQVLIRRNNTETLTTNDGSHTDTISGKGTFVYEVCETNLSSCSNRVTIVF